MQNIEIEVRCRDLAEVRARLATAGAQPSGVLVQTDCYFHAGNGRLKLREIDGEKAELIGYRRPDGGAERVSDYRVLAVSEPATLRELLSRALGVRGVVRKRRELWLLGTTRVHLDQVEELGKFLELETVVGERNQEDARQEFAQMARVLGVDGMEPVNGSYIDLLCEPGQRE